MKPNRVAIAFLAGVLLTGVGAFAQRQAKSASPPKREELRAVLVEARDAVIELAAHDPSSSDTSISEMVQQVVEWSLFIGDRENVRYLQQHLKEVYAEEIRDALEPASTLEDFATRVEKAEKEQDRFRHDRDLDVIISQEIKRGFLEHAAANASRMHFSLSRTRALGRVAIALHDKGETSAADRVVDAAIEAGLELESRVQIRELLPSGKLSILAGSLQEGNYGEGARKVLARMQRLLRSSAKSNEFEWRRLAESALRVGDLEIAREALKEVADEKGRSEIQDRIKASEARSVSPEEAVGIAATIDDLYLRGRTLCDIALRQGAARDERGAALTLGLALQAANRVEEFQVFLLNEIAWAQINSADREGAENTLQWALQANEKPGWRDEQVDGWAVIADTMAFLGHFERAHRIALKIKDRRYRGRALKSIAYREVIAGRGQEAHAWASDVRDAEERSAALLGIAEAIVKQLKSNRE